ncbi:lamin tail domain-containing protein 1 [Tupaia chinensis]|uniref:lamin tail domain-containing protein 1 n=1 Tax=Tupaia chinensis TaxID=246437 RepID=UPI0003C8E6B7|nr:lamin tail domain-containing protein 1 [Tupaia chinensis]
MKDTHDIQEAPETLQSEVNKQDNKMKKQELFVHRKEEKYENLPVSQGSSVHFYPKAKISDVTALSLSLDIPLGFHIVTPQSSGITMSTMGPLTSKSTMKTYSLEEVSSELSFIPEKLPEIPMIGEGEDYFLSLFGDAKKLIPHSDYIEKTYKHFSTILEEVGQSTSSSLGDIRIAEVKDMFIKLINSSMDKELEIGDHVLQQNVNGQTISSYRFLPNIIMQASSTVTVWAAESEAKHHPPTDFLWKEQNRFRTTPDCTMILCKPNGEAIAWYTPIHWKQAWEKLETDIEFERCSVVSPTFRRHVFHWTASTTTLTKEKQPQPKKETSKGQVEEARAFLERKREIPPTLLPNCSPWCHSPSYPAHPYCPLIEPHTVCAAGSSLGRLPRSQSARLSSAPGTKKKKTKLQSNKMLTQPLKVNKSQV